jgi:hypothetical protein
MVDHRWRDTRHERFFAVLGDARRGRLLAIGRQGAVARGGRAIWLVQTVPGGCVLAEVDLHGRRLRPVAPVSCGAVLRATDDGPVLLARGRVVDLATGRRVLRGKVLWTLAGGYALGTPSPDVLEDAPPITLESLRTGARRTIAWPSRIGGEDQVVADPRGGRLAVAFSDPAYEGHLPQVTDIWLLDPATGRARELPDMPAAVDLKATSMQWAPDGRLVLLATVGEDARTIVATWRPGERSLHVRPLPGVPGSGAFAVI